MAADQSANNKKGDLTTILLSIHDVLKLSQKGSELEFSASPSLFVPLFDPNRPPPPSQNQWLAQAKISRQRSNRRSWVNRRPGTL
jgi:hypothetical protein